MKRSIHQWRNCQPKAMIANMSRASLQVALEDAKTDILALHRLVDAAENLIAAHCSNADLEETLNDLEAVLVSLREVQS